MKIMSINLIKRVDSRAVSVEVSGCEHLPIQRPYVMHPTGMLNPARADIRWENGELVKLSVSGRKIRKDGSIGLADSTTHYVWYGSWQQAENTQPFWLQSLVHQFEPNTTTQPEESRCPYCYEPIIDMKHKLSGTIQCATPR
jgi:hypothetical protein